MSMTERVRRGEQPVWGLLSCGLLAMLATGCGGGSSPDESDRPQLSLAVPSAAELPSGTPTDAVLQLRNPGQQTLKGLSLQLRSDPGLVVHQLRCETALPSACGDFDGRQIALPELPAGSSVALKMRVASAPGQRGELSNRWTLVGAPGGEVGLVQTLRSQLADVAVQLAEPQIQTGGDAGDQHSYALSLSNAGPDEARDVELQLLASADLSLLGVDCVASGGANCAPNWTDRTRIARLPAGGLLRLNLRYRRAPGGGESGTSRHGVSLYVQAIANGDAQLANNRAEHSMTGTAAYSDSGGRFTAVSGRGREFDVIWNATLPWSNSWRALGVGLDVITGTPMDAAGATSLASSHPLPEGAPYWAFAGNALGLMAGAYELGHGPEFFFGARQLYSRWADLAGQRFVVLASESSLGGEPADAAAMWAEVRADGLSVCTDATQLDAQGNCPAGLIERFAVYPQFESFRLVSARREISVRIAATVRGPVLFSSGRDAAEARTRFWIGLPATGAGVSVPVPRYFGGYAADTLTDLPLLVTQKAPLATPMLELDQEGEGIVFRSIVENFPVSYRKHLSEQYAGMMEPSGQVLRGAAPGLLGGVLTLKTFSTNPADSVIAAQGAVHAISSPHLFAMLGAKGSPFMGRWVIVLGHPYLGP
jgi:hypothetical protein